MTATRPNAAAKQIPDHVTPQASPSSTPVATSQGRSHGGAGLSRRERWSWTRVANAATTKKVKKISSNAVREWTKCSPSTASRKPAAAPKIEESKMWVAVRASNNTVREQIGRAHV